MLFCCGVLTLILFFIVFIFFFFFNFSLSDDLVASVSRKMLKLWNARTSKCVRSTDIGYGLCCAFVPGDEHVVCGTKDGRVLLVSVLSGDVTQELAVHEPNTAVWSLSLKPDGSGFCTGGSDSVVRFFDFEASPTNGKLTIRHVRNLKMDDEILCVQYSSCPSKDPRKTLIAVSTLDNTVKIYFDDSVREHFVLFWGECLLFVCVCVFFISIQVCVCCGCICLSLTVCFAKSFFFPPQLKFFLSMYGHKLPVMAMDISSDDALLVTASSDKNVKIWVKNNYILYSRGKFRLSYFHLSF